MRSFAVFLVSAIIVGGAHTVAAQPPPLSLRDALIEARQANPELVALQRQYDTARAAIPEARFLDPPMFEAQIWGWPVTTLNPARTDMYMFMAEQTLPGRGKRQARELVATRDADVSRQQIALRANAIVNEVKQAYADLFQARATAALFEQQRPVLEDTAEAATLRYAAGHSGQHDTVKSIVELSRLETDAIGWREKARVAETRLNVLLGRAPERPIPTLAAVDVNTPVLAEAEQTALAGNPALVMIDAEIARDEAELARVRGERRPDFVVGGGYMLQPGGAGAWTARAGISWPDAPWSRGALDTRIDTQAKRVAAARAQRDVIVAAVRRAVHEAVVHAEAGRDRVRLLESSVIPHIEHAFDVARTAYASDRGEFADLLGTQRVLLSTRMEVVSARADLAKAMADLQMALGEDR